MKKSGATKSYGIGLKRQTVIITYDIDEFITLDENTLFETFDGFIENAPNVLQQLNLPLKRNNVDKGKNPYGNLYLCRGNDLFIVNGRIGDNKEGNLTSKCKRSRLYYL